MNPKSLLLAALCLLVVFISCDQSEEEEFSHSTPRIKTMTIHHVDGTTQIYSYEYDSVGKIVKRTYAPQSYESYHYLSDNMIIVHKYSNETLAYTDTLWLNDQGLVTTKKSKMSPEWQNLSATFSFTTTYEYNPEGYLVKSSEGHTSYEIQDGNTVKIMYSSYTGAHPGFFNVADSSNNLQVSQTYINEFSPNTINTIGNENMGMPFYGKQDKNLVMAYEYLFSKPLEGPGGPLYGNRFTYSYSYDARKRVTKRSTIGRSANTFVTYSYY